MTKIIKARFNGITAPLAYFDERPRTYTPNSFRYSGCLSAMRNSVRAAPAGVRRPYSQPCKVRTDTANSRANSLCDKPVFIRTDTTAGSSTGESRPAFISRTDCNSSAPMSRLASRASNSDSFMGGMMRRQRIARKLAYTPRPPATTNATIDATASIRHNAPVPFNHGTGFDRLINLADTRHPGGFFTSAYHHAYVFMAGRSGGAARLAGSRFRSVNPATRLPPPFDSGRQAIQSNLGAIMPSIVLRTFRAIFPLFAYPVATVAHEAEARALAALLVAQGKRATIQRAEQGFTVSEVAA